MKTRFLAASASALAAAALFFGGLCSPAQAADPYEIHVILSLSGPGAFLGNGERQALQFAASVWLGGVIIRTILVWHVTWCGNSFPHLFGYRNYETNDNSRNNMLVAIIKVHLKNGFFMPNGFEFTLTLLAANLCLLLAGAGAASVDGALWGEKREPSADPVKRQV